MVRWSINCFAGSRNQEPEAPPPSPSSTQIPGKSGQCGLHPALEGWVSFWTSLMSHHDKKQPPGFLLHWLLIVLKSCFCFKPSYYPPLPFFIIPWIIFTTIKYEKCSAEKRKRSNKMRNMFIPIISRRHLSQGLSPMKSIIALSKTQLGIGRMAFEKCLISWIQSNN